MADLLQVVTRFGALSLTVLYKRLAQTLKALPEQ